MWKLLTISLVSSSILLGAELSKIDESVVKFERDKIEKDKRFKLNDMKLIKKEKIDESWSSYLFQVNVEVLSNKQTISTADIILSNGKFIAPVLYDIKTGKALGKDISVNVDESYYKKENLVAGDFNATNKLVVFSDPVCPFCKTFVPPLMEFVEAHPKEIALFFYHYPLIQIHPSAETIIKATLALEKEGKNIVSKVYTSELDARESNPEKILKEFNDKLGTKLTLKDIESSDIEKRIKEDMKMAEDVLINSTPTLFINGEKDTTRVKYKDLVK